MIKEKVIEFIDKKDFEGVTLLVVETQGLSHEDCKRCFFYKRLSCAFECEDYNNTGKPVIYKEE